MVKTSKSGRKYGMRKQQNEVAPNQWYGTPQQEKFLLLYLDPKSKTFANPYESAMEAGFSESYARIISAPSVNRIWIKEARNLMDMGPEHIIQGLQAEAVNPNGRSGDKIRAYELLAKIQGMFVERKVVGHVNIEQALNDLK
jgi:phage terminase small subunit